MGSSDNRISVARAIEEPRDTDQELPPSGDHDTWPPTEVPTSATIPVPAVGDTIPTPSPSSGDVESVSIPPHLPVRIDDA